MKQEEFEWLQKWMKSMLNRAGIEDFCDVVDGATEDQWPPPIDKLSFATTLHCHKHHTNFEDKCPGCEKEKVPRQERKEGDPCNFPTLKTIPVPCPRPLKRCSCGVLDCDDTSHNGHAHPIELKPEEQLNCPDCGTATMGIGGEGAYHQCILCKKRWDFDWENPVVLNPQPNIRPTVPGMKEPKPDLKVGIAGVHCNGHDADFVTNKDGDYCCPGCFPKGLAKIDKQDLEFFVNCKTFRDNPPKTEVPCPCCGRPVEPPK